MTSSLALQLQKLAAPQTSILLDKPGRKSILFDPSEAAKYGRDIYYQIGRNGFDELAKSVEAVRQFDKILFGKHTIDIQRAVLDSAANNKLDVNINKCLLVLSPYLERQAALKAMEWLVFRFMANEMNKRALLMSIFPYYESTLFIRILQIIDVSRETDEWYWLLGSQKTGRPVAKATVFTRWAHYQVFRSFVADYLKSMIKAHSNVGDQKIAISFYVTTVVGGLCLVKHVKEEHLTSIVKVLPKCFSTTPELMAGTYFLMSHLAVRTKLAVSLLNEVLRLIVVVNAPPESLHEQHTLLLLTLTQHQNITTFTPEVAEALSSMPHVFSSIINLARTKSVAPFLSAYVSGFIGWLVSDSCPQDNSKKSAQFSEMIDIVESIPLSSSDSAKVIWSIIEAVKSHSTALEGLQLAGMLDQLEASHPEGHSQATARLIDAEADASTGTEYKKISKLLVGNETSSRNFLHLIHPNDNIRLKAVKSFLDRVNNNQEKDEGRMKLHLTSLLSDSSPDILIETFGCACGLQLLDPSLVISHSRMILKQKNEKAGGKWGKVKVVCLRYLTHKMADKYTEELRSVILHICLPIILFPTSAVDMILIKVILSSKMSESEPFLNALSRKCTYLMSDKTLKPQQYSEGMWSILPIVLNSLTTDQHEVFWSRFGSSLGMENKPQDSENKSVKNSYKLHKDLEGKSGKDSESKLEKDTETGNVTSSSDTSLVDHFVSLTLMCCALGEKLAETVRLKVGHRLLDACLLSLGAVKISMGKKVKRSNMLSSLGLATFLAEVANGSLPLSFLGFCLSQSLLAFSFPQPCRETPYWTLTMESGVQEGHLALLVKCVRCAMLLENYGHHGNKLRNKIMATILKECLDTSELRFSFLSILWGWVSTLPFSHIVDEKLQIWSLKLGTAMLSSQTSSLAWALGTSQPLVPSLLSALSHHRRPVRRQALSCIMKLAAVEGGRLTQDNHSVFLETIISQGEELVADASHIASLLAELHSKNKGKCRAVSQVLADIAANPAMPPHLCASIIFTLTKVTDSGLLLKLIPVADRILKNASLLDNDSHLDVSTSFCLFYILLHFNPGTSDVLDKEEGWSFFLKAVGCNRQMMMVNNEVLSPQSVLMDQVINHKFFRSIKNEKLQSHLWSVLITRVVESENPKEAEQLRKGLRKVSLDAALLVKQIEELKLSKTATAIRAAQAKRRKMKEAETKNTELLNWRKLDLMLETIGVMASLDRPWLLIGPLCQCLQLSLHVDAAFTDLTQQQLLSVLLHLLQKSSEELRQNLKSHVKLNTEVVVQCIRASSSPDTHRRAMLILSYMATIDPESVVQKVMPIFTFMGTSLMRRDDSYSFQVIHQTIQNVIPPLLQDDSEPQQHKLGRMCQVFVDALPDIPQHRRLPLFTQLGQTINPAKHLWIILTLLANGYVMRGNVKVEDDDKRGEERRGVPADIQFALTLASRFSLVEQTNACVQMMTYISALPMEKEDFSSQPGPPVKKFCGEIKANDIISLDLHTPRQICHFKHTLAALMAHLLASESYIGQVYEGSEHSKKLHGLYSELMEKTIRYLNSVSQTCVEVQGKPTERVLLSLQRKVLDVLDGVVAVLPPDRLLSVVALSHSCLVKSHVPLVRRRALEMLCAKLQPGSNYFSDSTTLMKLLHPLCKMSIDHNETVENRQTALLTVQMIIHIQDSAAKLNKIQESLATAVNIIQNEVNEKKLLMQALLVVAECVGQLRAKALEKVHHVMPLLTDFLRTESRVTKREDQYLFLASVTLAHKLVKTIPRLLPSDALSSLVCVLCNLCGDKVELGQAAGHIAAIRETIITKVELHVLLPTLTQAYKQLAQGDILSVGSLMEMMQKVLTDMPNKALNTYQNDIFTIFTQALDLRSVKGLTENTATVESSVFVALDKMLIRLNQHNNLAIFLSLQSWANEKPARHITFYRLADHLAGIFKVLFIKAQLAENILSGAASLLSRNNTLHHNDTIFGSDERATQNTCLLLSAIIDSLSKVFLYDSVSFTNQERFSEIVMPLTDQLENTIGGESEYDERIKLHLVPCLKNLAVAVGDDSLWKTLNRQILIRVRNDDQPGIVLAALTTFQTLIEALGSDYLEPLLSDSMPYITEALESSSSSVEEKTRSVFTIMEGILGQSLKEYLEY